MDGRICNDGVTLRDWWSIMLFSETFAITRTRADDWQDIFLPADTKLFVDPFLIWSDEVAHWKNAHGHLLDFFEMVFDLVRESNGNTNSIHWKKAGQLLLFKEPWEFCLGVAEGSPLGAGSGRGLQSDMLDGIRSAVGIGIHRLSHMETIPLFQGGMGVDRISDMVCNIIKSYFIAYTQQVCERHEIPSETVEVRNASWSRQFKRWEAKKVKLPINPYINRPIILTPMRFLRDIPVASPDGFWDYSWSELSESLRGDFSYDIASRVNRRKKSQLARQHPEAVALYLKHLEDSDEIHPYSIDLDPKFLVKWYHEGKKIWEGMARTSPPLTLEEFNNFISKIVNEFKMYIEHQGGWIALWNDKRPVDERTVQVLFRGVVIHYCRAENIDLTSESNAGRGPVDFKFSQGWSARALVEMKLFSNTRFWNGILAQQPTYQISEQVNRGIFVAVGFRDHDFSNENTAMLQQASQLVAEKHGVFISGVTIDARKKTPASKLQDHDLMEKLRTDINDSDESL